MHVARDTVVLVSDAAGDATGYSARLTGRLVSIHYVKAGANNYADTVDFTITNEATGQSLWAESNVTASKVCAPRMATHGVDGVASLYAAGGTAVQDAPCLANDRVKIVIAQAGDSTTGTFYITVA